MTDSTNLLAGAPASVGAMFAERVRKTPHLEAYRYPEQGRWVSLTWAQTKERADVLAAGFLALGLGHEERVSLACSTRIEWVLLDLAVNSAGGAVTTIYPNSGPTEFVHIVSHSDTRIFVAENAAQLAKLDGHEELTTQVHHVVLIDGEAPADPLVVTWAGLEEAGRRLLAEDPECVRRATEACTRDTLATLIYTSGTTGLPKGVELTHGAWVYEGVALEARQLIQPGQLQYLWLPLSHVFGKLLIAAQLGIGFASAVDGRVDRIVDGLGETHPDLMCGVPRIYEKVRNAVMTSAPTGAVKSRIARWAFAVGRDSRPYRLAGRRMPALLAAQYRVADRLVFSKLKARVGGNISFFISGSAKLSSQVQEWFYSAGLLIVEGYGMTEVTVPFVNDPSTPRFGTVGTPNPGTEVRIAADGEILLKGPGIMRGYHKDPELTAEVLTEDGWFSTGDLGFLDADGYLTITDRKKDLMKTSAGKYVAPQKVENAITANIPYVSQIVAVGDGRKYISAIITLDPVALTRWAKNHKREHLTYAELTQLPEIRRSIDRFMARANDRLEPWETIKRYAILDHEFSVDEGTTTPSMKVRRAIITERYNDVVDSLYDAEE